MTEKLFILSTAPLKLIEVEGQRIDINDEPCFVFKETFPGKTIWNVSHIETGAQVATSDSLGHAIVNAENKLQRPDAAEVIENGRNNILELGFTLPINQ